MDHLVKNLENAYSALISAATTVLEAKDSKEASDVEYLFSLSHPYVSFVDEHGRCLLIRESYSSTSHALFERTAKTDDALERFHNNLQLFQAACDQTQEFVEYLRLRIGSECLVDEATGPLTGKIAKSGQDGAENRVAIPSLSALRLEQMSKAVRWLVIELQQGAASATPRSEDNSGGLDIRPEDDTHQ